MITNNKYYNYIYWVKILGYISVKYTFQMASILDMINSNLIKIGDSIEFTFKGNTFRAKILRGGLIGKCQQYNIHEHEPKDILSSTVGFSSLTAWTESCLQDILEEYYTRYSSWKRVFHKETKRSMSDLRDQCKLQDTKRKHEDISELYKEIFRLQHTIDEMNEYIGKLHRGDQLKLKKWTYLHIEPQSRSLPTVKKIKTSYDKNTVSSVQDSVCSDTPSELNDIVNKIISS